MATALPEPSTSHGRKGGSNSGEVEEALNIPPALAERPEGLPPGKYKLVGWDMDTTGRRLIDELCQIAVYTPEEQYSQYIMPHCDLNPGARRRHNLRVVSVGRYRMLKDTTTQKVLRTKSIIAALIDFVNWLDAIKAPEEKVILIYHEPRRLYPTLLLNVLIKYHLFDRFRAIVSGFTDSYALCFELCKYAVKSVSLRVLSRLLLDEGEQSVKTAMDRATATYKIVEQLANQGGYQDLCAGGEGCGGSSPSKEMMSLAVAFARPVATELEALNSLKDLLQRQNTFRAVFAPLLRCSRQERRRLIMLRRILADAGLLYDQLKDAWHEGKRAGLENAMSPLELTTKAEDLKELVKIFDNHFDPEQRPHYSVSKPQRALEEELDELYLSSDSNSSDQLSASFSFSGLSATFLVDEDIDDYYFDF